VCANVDDLDGGGGLSHQPDVQKRNLLGVSGVRIGVEGGGGVNTVIKLKFEKGEGCMTRRT